MNIRISKNTNSASTRLFFVGKYKLPKEDWMDETIEEELSARLMKGIQNEHNQRSEISSIKY